MINLKHWTLKYRNNIDRIRKKNDTVRGNETIRKILHVLPSVHNTTASEALPDVSSSFIDATKI